MDLAACRPMNLFLVSRDNSVQLRLHLHIVRNMVWFYIMEIEDQYNFSQYTVTDSSFHSRD